MTKILSDSCDLKTFFYFNQLFLTLKIIVEFTNIKNIVKHDENS